MYYKDVNLFDKIKELYSIEFTYSIEIASILCEMEEIVMIDLN